MFSITAIAYLLKFHCVLKFVNVNFASIADSAVWMQFQRVTF